MFTVFLILPGKEIFTGKIGDFYLVFFFRSKKKIIFPFSYALPLSVGGEIFYMLDMENCSGNYGRIPEYSRYFFHLKNIRLYQ